MLAIAAVCALTLSAQNKMRVWYNNSIVFEDLVENIDSITFVEPELDQTLLYVEDVFTISGRGTVLTGKVLKGRIYKGQEIQLLNISDELADIQTTVGSIEMSKKEIEEALPGDNIGILLPSDIDKAQIGRGAALVAKSTPYAETTKLKATVYMHTKDEGGRSTPVAVNYRPQIYVHSTDITCALTDLGKGGANADLFQPGETHTDVVIEIMTGNKIVTFLGDELPIREGGHTVATATVTGIE